MATTSSGTVTTTTVYGQSRLTGLSSGLDVDSIVEQLMTAEKNKLNKLKQQEQLATWRQEAYRSVITKLKTFTDEYFDISSSTSMLSQKNYRKFQVASSDSAVSAATNSSATAGSHTITVSQLATAATRTGSAALSKDVQGTAEADYAAAAGKSFTISLDGTDYTVSLDSAVTDAVALQSAIDDAVGEGKLTVSTLSSEALTITSAADSGVQKITLSAPESGDSALSDLGFGTDAVLSNRISPTDTLETLADQFNTALTFNADGQVDITINGVNFTFDKADTLSEVMEEINDSDAGVTMKYDELSGKLVLTADNTGAGAMIVTSETDSNFLAVALDEATAGQDAKLTVDGVSLTRSSNSVTVDGVIYSLNETTSEAVTVSLQQDVDGIYENIENFVTDYNALLDTINGLLSEDYDLDYPPLTDAQKEEMTDDEIANWETQAKTGLLEDDPILQTMLDKLRSALMSSVSCTSLDLAEIGITTSSYDEKGKLHIAADTLMQAIQDDPEEVMNLFAKQSPSHPGTSTVRGLTAAQRTVRYGEEGIAYRLYDILQDNIGTIRDSSGNKGFLLEKAGMESDASVADNSLTDLLQELSEKIEKEEDRLDDKADSLYAKYTNLETYINQMNAQLAALTSSTSSGS